VVVLAHPHSTRFVESSQTTRGAVGAAAR
jgi:hypothetical protein